jgi:kynurenine formamidase
MTRPLESDVIAYIDSLSNWGRWGDDDELGTLNFITPEKRLQALALPREGRAISCSRLVSTVPSAENPHPLLRLMIRSGEGATEHGRSSAADWIGMRFHGRSVTHLDSLSHYFWNRMAYNGRPSATVRAESGAEYASVEAARDGIVTRGVLLDVARSEGVAFFPSDHEITVDELERCETAQQVKVGRGDVLMVRTGRDRRPEDGRIMGAQAGLRADCLPWLHSREISLLAGDGVHDNQPPVYQAIASPIHTVGIVALGLWLLDNAYLEDLADHCATTARWEFLFMTSPLLLEAATGSPTNPLALV